MHRRLVETDLTGKPALVPEVVVHLSPNPTQSKIVHARMRDDSFRRHHRGRILE
jgi:hypothetical protein